MLFVPPVLQWNAVRQTRHKDWATQGRVDEWPVGPRAA